MKKRAAKPDNTPWVSPYIIVQDVEKTVNFYEKAFGFAKSNLMPDDNGKVMHAEMKYNDMLIMLGKQGAWGGTSKAPESSGVECPIGLYIYVEDVDQFYQHAIKSGAKSVKEPEDAFWGDRMCSVIDPEGYKWTFATNMGEFDPTKIPSANK